MVWWSSHKLRLQPEFKLIKSWSFCCCSQKKKKKKDFIYSRIVPKVHCGVVGGSSRSRLGISELSAAAPPFLLMGWRGSWLHVCRNRSRLFLSWVWMRRGARIFAVPISALPARGPSTFSAGRLLGPFSHPGSQWYLTAAFFLGGGGWTTQGGTSGTSASFLLPDFHGVIYSEHMDHIRALFRLWMQNSFFYSWNSWQIFGCLPEWFLIFIDHFGLHLDQGWAVIQPEGPHWV